MSAPREIVLKGGRDKSLRRRHPWVFSGAVDAVRGDPQPGDSVLVRGADGTALGWAAYSPASQIRGRMWTFDADHPVTPELISTRIAAAAHRRRHLLTAPDAAARLVYSEADGVPGLIADRYGDTVVAQFTTVGADAHRATITAALAGLDGVASVYERSDADVRQREGLAARVGLLSGREPGELLIREHRLRAMVDVRDGHKTGFYLDQREARGIVPALASGARVLNAFAYTGAFSVLAAQAGAQQVVTVDSSAAALAMARRNGQVNDVALDGDDPDGHQLVEADVFTFLRGQRDRAKQYDLIILDPPKLANSEAHLPKATRAYKDLNLLGLKLLAPGGTLMTFSCSGAMTMDLFQKVVAGAALDAGRETSIIGRLHQPEDHPVPLAFPEAEYLKGLIVRAE